MDFFLGLLSLLDACYTLVITPSDSGHTDHSKMVISYGRCPAQFFFFTTFAIIFTISSLYLLTVMAYDNFVAISNPLHYNVGMSPGIYMGLLAGAYVCGLSRAILRTTHTFTLSSCVDNQINFFFCHLPPLLKLASSSTTQSEIVILFAAKLMFLANGMIILVSYTLTIRTILRVKAAGGKAKTFSTCTSYLTSFVLFFGTLAFMCQRSNSDEIPREQDYVFYTVVIPMLNPLTYSLRNKDIEGAIRKVICKIQFPRDVA